MKEINPKVYQKHHSFQDFQSRKDGAINYQKDRAIRVLREYLDGKFLFQHKIQEKSNFRKIVSSVLQDLTDPVVQDQNSPRFKITLFIAEEMYTYSDEELIRFFYHRFRYDIHPQKYIVDDYPPYLQIEPSSLCNYKCVFCYQTDSNYFKKTNEQMGSMSLELFKTILGEIEGEIEFLSLASRGEPMMAKEIEEILKYSEGKFLNLKVNTNASLLSEKKIHSLLSGGVKTIVFSADAAEEPLYSQLRVNGKLDKVLKNVELFHKIRSTEYPNLKVITRVSGVKVSDSQSFEKMQQIWGDYVDQIAFVNYNPWENIYETEPNGQEKPCSDLFRRMFVWQDGSSNPCDTDYKSTLTMGKFPDKSIKDLWNSQKYNDLRQAHLTGARQVIEPCKRCSVI
jgi:radical SAM protein with 4Fe4S-binding SPASM domain